MNVKLFIENANESKTVELEKELTIGRTEPAQMVLDDQGLSRLNTTIFIDDGEVLLTDENSTNGTFLNNEKVSGRPRILRDGDRIRLGSHTTIRVEIADERIKAAPGFDLPVPSRPVDQVPDAPIQIPERPGRREKPPPMLIGAIAMMLAIIFFGGVAFWFASGPRNAGGPGNVTKTPPTTTARIPVRVIDPLGGEDEDNLDDLIASWETEEDPLKAEDLKQIDSVSTTDSKKPSDLNVSIDFWRKQLDKALNHGATGAEPAGLIPVPEELFGGNVIKQKAKLNELIRRKGYKQPLDFADLAELRLEGKFLGELPMATESYVLDIGGSATGDEFTSFDFAIDGSQVRAPITPSSPKYKYLKELADNFDGQKYDLNNPADRKQMRIRLLRMYNKDSRKEFEDFANAYYQQFHVPLRVTSLTRSMDYQIGLNKSNANSFKVSGKGSLPPHTSGCAFDISRKNLTRDEQNFLMQRLSQLERAHKLDSLREGSANACFHSFIYPDGMEPASLNLTVAEILGSSELATSLPFWIF